MNEQKTKEAIDEQGYCRTFSSAECLKQIAINLARIVDRLDALERSVWLSRD